MEREDQLSSETLWTVASDVIGFGMTFGLEMARASMVHPELDPLSQNQPPVITHPDWLVHTLEHGGDSLEGYGLSMAAYVVFAKFLGQKVPEKLRLAYSLVASNAVIAVVEVGLQRGHPDFLDLPAGIVGSSFFLGMHLLGRWYGKRADAKDMEIQRDSNPS